PISSIAIDGSGTIYVVFRDPITTAGGVRSPLFASSGGSLVHRPCTGLPAQHPYGRVVADPVAGGVLYLAHGGSVFRLDPSGAVSDVSVGLPGAWIYDLWIANVGDATTPKILLRAAIPTRSCFELDVTSGAPERPIELYLRDNL